MDTIFSKDSSASESFVSKDKIELSSVENSARSDIKSNLYEKNLSFKELSKNSLMTTDTNLTNKEMLMAIRNKISKINQSVNIRQQELSSLIPNFSDSDETLLSIEKISDQEFKLKSKTGFETILDQFLAGKDQSMVFKLFSQYIEEIRVDLQHSNSMIRLIKAQNENDREAMEKRFKIIESELSDIKLKKMHAIRISQEYLTCSYPNHLENIIPHLREIKTHQSRNNDIINKMKNKVRTLKKELKVQTLHNESQSEEIFYMKKNITKKFEEIGANAKQIVDNLKNQVINMMSVNDYQTKDSIEALKTFKIYLKRKIKALRSDFLNKNYKLESEINEKFGKMNEKISDFNSNIISTVNKAMFINFDNQESKIDEKFNNMNEKISEFNSNITSTVNKIMLINFDNLDLDKKIKVLECIYLENFEGFKDLEEYQIKEIIRSDDEEYVFICNFYLGNLNQGIFN